MSILNGTTLVFIKLFHNVIVENLKEMLSKYDTNKPIMFGHPLKALGVSCDTMYYWHIHFLYYHAILSLVNYLV